MEDNIYMEIIGKMESLNLPEEEKKTFFRDFWSTLSREEKIVLTVDALQAFEDQGLLGEFIDGVNDGIGVKQDGILDDYINKKISEEEFLEKIKRAKKIEKKSSKEK